MSHQPVAYILFGVGGVIALVMEMLGVPALIFALGMYLPLELNTPALVGGFLSHWLNRRSERMAPEAGRSVRERGVIIASGLMAGGALGGVFGAGLRLFPAPTAASPAPAAAGAMFRFLHWYREDLIKTPFFDNEPVAQIVSIVLFLGLCLYVWFGSLGRRRAE